MTDDLPTESPMSEPWGYAHVKKGPDGKPLNIVHRDVTPQNLIVA